MRQLRLGDPDGAHDGAFDEGQEGEGEDKGRGQADGLDHAHGRTVGRLQSRWSKITLVPSASVRRTRRDTGFAGIGDLHLHPKYPVGQV